MTMIYKKNVSAEMGRRGSAIQQKRGMKSDAIMAFLTLLCCLTAPLLSACSSDDDADAPQPIQERAHLKITVTDEGMGNGVRAVTDASTYVTSFSDGDRMGLFAVYNGQVVDTLDNIPIRFYEGEWIPDFDLTVSKELRSAKFYAYYPYREGVSIDPTAANPMDVVVRNWPVMSDQSGDGYEQSDLLCCDGVMISGGEKEEIGITLSHVMGLCEWQLPVTRYVFTNEGLSDIFLTLPDVAFEKDGEAVTPAYSHETGKYRLIVRPEDTRDLVGYYSAKEGPKRYVIDAVPAAGTVVARTVGGGARECRMTLEEGDLVCADGTLLKPSEAISSENVVGVVYSVGTSDALSELGFTHGLVLSTKRNGKCRFVGASSGTAGWLAEAGFKAPATETVNGNKIPAEENLVIEGYENTEKLMALTTDITGWSPQVMQDAIQQWRDGNVLPQTFSKWYLPSLKEWNIIKDREAVIQASMEAVGGDNLWGDDFVWNRLTNGVGYWSSNVRSEALIWVFTGLQPTGSAERDHNYCIVAKGSLYPRYAFAF